MRLGTLKPRLPVLKAERSIKPIKATARMAGRALQDRRLKMWTANPHCAACGRYVLFPSGFELDHITPLHMGGEDAEGNTQILCVERDPFGNKTGCHVEKTAGEAGPRGPSKY